MEDRRADGAKKRRRTAGDTVAACIKFARNGAGWITHPETGAQVWVEQRDLGTALPGDTVSVRLFHPAKGETAGRVEKVLERSERDIVGTLAGIGRFSCVIPLNPAYHRDFYVADTKGAKEGDRVVMRFVRWENRHVAPEGEITEIIGPASKPSLDTISVMKQYGLPEAFPEAAAEEAERIREIPDDARSRTDFRRKFVFTCDPAEARDFDDALSLERDGRGRRVLGVHIADVSRWIRRGSAIDAEAYERGTSVYLCDRVVPMLPEQLSNGVCSLLPGKTRCAMSVFITFDAKGVPVARSFARTLVRSSLRLEYSQLLEILRGGRLPGIAIAPENLERLRELGALARQMTANRKAAGSLEMELPEVSIKLDENGEISDVRTERPDDAHRLVEECMVAANEAVAAELRSRRVRSLARYHEKPDPDRLQELSGALRLAGVKTGDLSRPRAIPALLEKMKGSPLESTVSMQILRSMKRACYSSEESGHFGLAKTDYTHFTSPIRRYPDLTVHRQLAAILSGKSPKERPQYLSAAAKHCSEREQAADEAERALTEIKKFRFLAKQIEIGDLREYEAVVAKCTSAGAFIDIPDLAVGGLVHIADLSGAYVRFDAGRGELSAGRDAWSAGTRMRVRVKTVDIDARRADFVPAGGPDGGAAGRPARRQGNGGRKTSGAEGKRAGRGRRGRA